MKQEALKKIIKQAVKEAIQEEIKDILLEAVRAPKQTVVESVQPKQQVVEGPSMSSAEKRYLQSSGRSSADILKSGVPKHIRRYGYSF